MCDKCKCTNSPWYVATGTYTTSVEDLRVTTVGSPLVVTRFYDSSRPMDGPVGVGWTLSLNARLYYAVYLSASPSTYSKEARLVLPDGSRRTYRENPDGTFAPPPGRRDTLVRNPDGTFDLTPQRSRSQYHFFSSGALDWMADEHGNRLTATYDGSGRLERLSDNAGSGRYLEVFYGADGRISTVRDSANRQVQYEYDSRGLLTYVTDPVNRRTTLAYTETESGWLFSGVTDHYGRAVSATSYGSNCMAATHEEDGPNWTYIYNYQGVPNRTAKRDPFSIVRTWVYTFNSEGLITDRTQPGGATQHTDYTADGQVERVIDEVGVRTFYTYDARGNVASVTRDETGPTAVRFDYAYDPNFPDNVASITPRTPSTGQIDPNWQAWRYDYHQAGSPSPGSLFHVYRVKSDGAEETLATYTYDTVGRVTRLVSATGGMTDYEYDPQGDLFRVTAPANNDTGTRPVTSYGHDGLGRVTSVTDPLGKVTSYTYDALNRVLTVTLPKPTPSSPLDFTTTYVYDGFDAPSGFVFTTVTDPNGKVTRMGYDQYERLRQQVDALGGVTTYTYTEGLLTSIRDANGNLTTYEYNDQRRLSAIRHPNASPEFYEYYGDGSLKTWFPRLHSFTYEYDRHKRLSKVIHPPWPNFPTVTYSYTGQKLTQVVDERTTPADTHTFSYDSSYRVSSTTQGSQGTLSYTFNADDTVATQTVQGGPSTTYAYYPDGSLNTIAWTPVAGQFRYRYTLPGQYESVTFPNGATRNFSYDDQGRLLQLSNLDPVAGNLATYAYGYDLNHGTGLFDRLGQRVSMTATVPSQGLLNHQTRYEYDSLYQLTKATYPNVAPFNGEVHSWTYDGIGNRLTNTVNGSTQTYTYQKVTGNPLNWQRMLSDGVNTYTYDSNGSIATKDGPGGNFIFNWTPDNRLAWITGSGSPSYGYDYEGRRRAKNVSGATTTYLYDSVNLVREGGASSADYLFGLGIDEPLAMNRGGQTYYYAADALGSVNLLSNAAGAIQNTYLYDVWGQTKNQTGSLANPFVYTAREIGEAGALFYRARYYQPGVGRFLSEDPLGKVDGPNLYLYAKGDPIQFYDPTGLKCGPGFFGGLLVPDRAWGWFDFNLACGVHDACYASCGRPKPVCDKLFLETMMDDCRTRRRQIARWCAEYAFGYYQAVVTGGGAAYNAAQAKDCSACPKALAPPGGWPIPPQPPKLCGNGPNCAGIL